MHVTKKQRADVVRNAIDSLIDVQYPNGVDTWQIMGIAAGVGPYSVEVIAEGSEVMLRLRFRDDGSEVVVSPDGGEIVVGTRLGEIDTGITGLRGDPA